MIEDIREIAKKDAERILQKQTKRKIKFGKGEPDMENKELSFTRLVKGIITGDLDTETKALVETGTAGYLVPPEHANYFYKTLWDQVVTKKAGAQIIRMKSNVYNIPKALAGVTAYWVDEATNITPSEDSFAQIQLIAKKVASLTTISTELLEDSNPSIDKIVMDNLAQALAVAMDKEFLIGDGTHLTGIANTTGVNTIQANAQDLTFDLLLEARRMIEQNSKGNIKPDTIIMHPAVYYKLVTQKDTTGRLLVDTSGMQADLPDRLLGMRVLLTTTLPIDLTYDDGTTTYTDLSLVLMGNFKYALIGERRGISIEANKGGTYFTSDVVAIKSTARVGFAVAYPEAFSVIWNVKTT